MENNIVKRLTNLRLFFEKELCPFCNEFLGGGLGNHIRKEHGEENFIKAIINAKLQGISDTEIGSHFGISFNQLERIITKYIGINISKLARKKKINRLEPKDFKEETTTVWSFKQRGDWATHSGIYRGNWSPYIPRNIILKYSRIGECVLDYFVGGGTTAIEAKLLGRRCIARDINPFAIKFTLENLSIPSRFFTGKEIYEPYVSIGDARDLSDINNDSIDLICAHPPYAGIIGYSSAIEGDLSKLSVNDFLIEISKVAKESIRVLKPGRKCVILIGDTRRAKHIVPIGFKTIRVFLETGFILKELIIKRQHNCKTTGFWYNRSIKYNFLLLAHEYLPVFEKPYVQDKNHNINFDEACLSHDMGIIQANQINKENLETTTVWIFPKEKLDEEIKRNIIGRFAKKDAKFIEVVFDGAKVNRIESLNYYSLVYLKSLDKNMNEEELKRYYNSLKKVAFKVASFLEKDGYLIIDVRDYRINDELYPTGLFVYEFMEDCYDVDIKEIVIVVPEENEKRINKNNYLEIIHRYLLIYIKK